MDEALLSSVLTVTSVLLGDGTAVRAALRVVAEALSVLEIAFLPPKTLFLLVPEPVVSFFALLAVRSGMSSAASCSPSSSTASAAAERPARPRFREP